MSTEARATLRRILGWLRVATALALVAVWVVLLRPQGLGGPADYVMVSGTSMLPTMRSGDLVVVRRQQAYAPGDVVAYKVPEGDVGAGQQVIHRITASRRDGYVLQGDNRSAPDVWRPRADDVVGKAWIHVPYAGRVLLFVRDPVFVGGFVAFMVFGLGLVNRGSRRPAAAECGDVRSAWGECAWTARDLEDDDA